MNFNRPAYIAAYFGYEDMIKLLLEKNLINLNTRDLLASAIRGTQSHIVHLFIQAGCDIVLKNEKEETYLHFAAKEGNAEIATFLIEVGLSLDTEGIWGKTPSDYVFYSEDPALKKVFKSYE